MTETDEIHTIDSELQDIRHRDSISAETWFKQPAIGACGRAFIDRRRLLQILDDILEGLSMETETVDSTSDRRVVNNVMRHEYRVLTETEKDYMRRIKDAGLEFSQLLQEYAEKAGQDRHASRELNLAQQRIEEAVMWAVKHITR